MLNTNDITERVKTFEDAVAALGSDNQLVIDYYAIADKTCARDILAFAKLRVIAEALNEGWRPKFDGKESRYYPWFYLYTKEEYDNLNKKKRMNVVSSVALTKVLMRLSVSHLRASSWHQRTCTLITTLCSHSKRESSLYISQCNLPTFCMTFYLRN